MRLINKLVILVLIGILTMSVISCKEKTKTKEETKPVETKTNEVSKTKEPQVSNVFYRVDFVTDIIQNEKVEMALFEKEPVIEKNGNPYDYNYMKVIVSITSPSGEVTDCIAFWYQDYQIVFNQDANISVTGISGVASTNQDEVQGLETVSAIGDPHYRVRFTPYEVGTYSYVIKVYKMGTLISTEHEKEFEVLTGSKETKGVLEVDPTNNRTFRFSETKETFVTIGQNTCWYTNSARKTEDYGVWFENMALNNMNTTRIWMATWGFCLHWNKSFTDFSNAYAAAARLDKMVDYAIEYGIYFMLCLNNHGQFSTMVNSEWDKNPYNVENGGILNHPYEFFYKEEAMEAYKNELLYIIARYGYSSNVLCWELFNEVDWIDSYSMIVLKFKNWHQVMSEFIKENDPYHHMVSTSYKGTDGNANSLDSIDFVSPHDYSYSNKNMIASVASTQKTLTDKYDKPVFFGEIGMNGENGYNNYTQDKTGITLHQAMWSGMMAGGAGGAMNWWWDSYVHPYNLYYRFKGAGAFAQLLDLSGSDYSVIKEEDYEINNSNLGLLGYKFSDRLYGYVYDKAWTYYNTSMVAKQNIEISIPFTDGTYTITFYDTDTGEAISTDTLAVSYGKAIINISSVTYDIAFIIK